MNRSGVVLVILSASLFSCGDKDGARIAICGDLSSEPIGFDIAGMELETMVESEFPEYYWRIFGDQYLESSSIPFDHLVLSIDSVGEYIYRESARSNRHFRLSLFNRAYACSPALPSITENVVEFNITSSRDFDDANPAGASLNVFFDVIFATSETEFVEYIPLESGETEVSAISVEEYMDQEEVMAGYTVQLRLNTEPQYLEDHVFFINITLDTGEAFFLETAEINFIEG